MSGYLDTGGEKENPTPNGGGTNRADVPTGRHEAGASDPTGGPYPTQGRVIPYRRARNG